MALRADKTEKLYYTQGELAEEFRVSPGTVIKWRSLGYLEYFQPPGSNRVLYPVDGVERFRKNFTYRKEVVQLKQVDSMKCRRVAPKTDWRI